jgi:hypothetical protein
MMKNIAFEIPILPSIPSLVSKVWSTLESPRITVTLHFRGVIPSPSRILLTGGQRVSDIIRVSNTLAAGLVDVAPTSKVNSTAYLLISIVS